MDTKAWELVKSFDQKKWNKARDILINDSSIANYQDTIYENSLLFWAALNDNVKASKILLDFGADVNTGNTDNESPLEIAAHIFTECDSPILEMMLKHQPEDDSLTQYRRNEALVKASSDCLKKVKLLIEYGANPYYTSQNVELFYGYNSIQRAKIHEKYSILRYFLIELKLNPDSGITVNNGGDSSTVLQSLNEDYKKESRYGNEEIHQQIKELIDFLEQKK